MKRYTAQLAACLPRVAPEFDFVLFDRGENFGLDEQWRLPREMRKARADLAHFTSLYAPLFSPRPYVITIHDLIHLRYPQFFKRRVGPYYRTAVRLVASRAARVITDDTRTVGDLQRFLGVPRERCSVVPLGVDQQYLQVHTKYRGALPYFLYVGNHRAHKNLRTLFEAWHSLGDERAADLYVTGPDDFEGSLVEYQTARRQIVCLGEVPAARMPALYAGAVALVHPALCEGFGLPMLEAMAARTCVIASESSAPMVLQSGMLLFPPTDAAALRARMLKVLTDEGLRSALVSEGRRIAERLTWEACARATADVYREILEQC
ncbi:MAG: glycosyltransferase family 4 protein [Candidatus Eremiobacteraeota bacterium]|nr:glycosyltransferase family 4 protein [Candidatus Eremiobacteraeota bacterium]